MNGLAETNECANEDAMRGRYLTFLIGQEVFGIDIQYVMEIVSVQPVTQLPEMPDHIIGIINLRGKVIPIMDARLRLQRKRKDYDDKTCVIILYYNEAWLGLVVDSVFEVMSISDEDISDSQETFFLCKRGFIMGIGKKEDQMILLIDGKRLLDADDFEAVAK